MASLAESLSERLVLKAYTDASYAVSSEPVSATDPAATGGQVWRHAPGPSMSLSKDTYSPSEIRVDRLQPIDKHGTRRLSVTVPTLLSCLTHKVPLEAVVGGTWGVAVTADQSDFTSIAADNATAKLTLVSGDPVAKGFRVGDIVRAGGMSVAGNNAKNFVILAFGGTSNRDITVYPAPTDQAADTAFTLASIGKPLFAPAAGPTKRKFALELFYSDPDLARLGTEITFGGFTLSAAPNQDARLDFTGMGRSLETYAGASAPFFSGPTAQTTTDIISSMDGVLRIGSTLAAVTGATINFQRSLAAPAQLHPDGLAAGVVATNNAVIGGDFTVFLSDHAMQDAFRNATELALMLYMPASNVAASPAMTFYLARLVIISAEETTIDGAKALQCRYSAGPLSSPGLGVENSPLRICDTEA